LGLCSRLDEIKKIVLGLKHLGNCWKHHAAAEEDHMEMRATVAITLVVSAAVLTGCKQPGAASGAASVSAAVASANYNPNDAIQSAIQVHLAHNGNLRLDAFDMTLKQVTFDGDQAQAEVEFRAKTGSGTMQLTYALAKQGGAWAVVESKPDGSNFSHPPLDKNQVPAAGGKMGGNPDIFEVLDKVHGRTAAAPQGLPPGPSIMFDPPEIKRIAREKKSQSSGQ
jgi:spore coat protein U-like protein